MPVNITELNPVLDPGFSYPGHTAGQPLSAQTIDNFDSFAKVEAGLPASVAAKDNPYMTVNDKIFAARHNVVTWTAISFLQASAVQYQGKFYYANAATVAGDVPGASSKWSLTGAPYIS